MAQCVRGDSRFHGDRHSRKAELKKFITRNSLNNQTTKQTSPPPPPPTTTTTTTTTNKHI